MVQNPSRAQGPHLAETAPALHALLGDDRDIARAQRVMGYYENCAVAGRICAGFMNLDWAATCARINKILGTLKLRYGLSIALYF